MRHVPFALLPLLALAVPAHATGGMSCRTAGDERIEIDLGMGRTIGGSIFQVSMRVDGREVPVRVAQSWLHDGQFLLMLSDPGGNRIEAVMATSVNGDTFDGSIRRGNRRHWIRCYES